MIKINSNPIIVRLLKRNTCATLIITNVEKLPVRLIYKLANISFFTDLVNDYRDFICVVPLENCFYTLLDKIISLASFSKIEEME